MFLCFKEDANRVATEILCIRPHNVLFKVKGLHRCDALLPVGEGHSGHLGEQREEDAVKLHTDDQIHLSQCAHQVPVVFERQ